MNPAQRAPSVKLASRAGGCIIFLLMASRALALDPDKSVDQFNCQSWTRQSGLPADKINAISQTVDGFLWLGTQNGLVQFDGSEFKPVPVDLPQSEGEEVRSLAPSRGGGLWLAINDGPFGRFDGERFVGMGDGQWAGPDVNANVVLESRKGVLWGGADLGLISWDGRQPHKSLFTGSVPIVISLAEDLSGRIWAGTAQEGLYCWADGKIDPVPNPMLRQRNLFALAADNQGEIWVGTDQGLFEVNAGGKVEQVPGFNSEVRVLLVDRHGILWVGTSGSGLARYENGRFTYLGKADGLASDYVTSLFEDAEGSLWIGTRDGLSQLTDLKFPIYTDREGIDGGSVTSVAAARHGGLWITTASGTCWFDGKTCRKFTNGDSNFPYYVKLGFESRNGDFYMVDGNKTIEVISGNKIAPVCTNTVWPDALGEDAESVLVGVGDTLCRIEGGKLRPYVYQAGSPPIFYWINNLYTARDGAIWVASNNGIFRIQNGRFSQWPAEHVNCIFEDVDGSIWAGLTGGVARVKDGQLKYIKPQDGLFDDRIYSIVPDDMGYFWFDSGNGIFRVARRVLNDFADGKAQRIQGDAFTGLDSVKSSDRIDQEPSGCKTTDGRIWFPTPMGVAMINPGGYYLNRVAPRVYLEKIRVNGREINKLDAPAFHANDRQVEFFFTALDYVAPKKIKAQYQLDGFDPTWIDAGARRDTLYSNLKPGHYTFRVRACNADGMWNERGDSFDLDLPPQFYETTWFRLVCILLLVLGCGAVYRWKVRRIEHRQRMLQADNDLLESKVAGRTAELAVANASLHEEVEDHKRTEFLLQQRTQSLEAEIEERKRIQLEVERVHHELLEASRMAGMAEVATGVLHNVGNVLNSINVSTTLLSEHAAKSKVGTVGRVAALLQENAGRLGEYLTQDAKGRRIPAFLAELAAHLSDEKAFALDELRALEKNVAHIKDIVAMQQSYAKVAGVTQSVAVTELLEDALRMNESALLRHGVQVVREYGVAPPEAIVDKHKVMQILINLIRNAKYACDDGGQAARQLTLCVRNGGDRVKISVQDNGIGIPAENLNRIFNYGFTTRKNGHGFGLHSGALAAKEMGGSLTAHSDGPGQGATFILELPLQPPDRT